MTVKHKLVSDHSDQETYQKIICLLQINDAFPLSTFQVVQLVSYLYQIH